MNDNNTPKFFTSLSEQINTIYDHRDEIDTAFKNIEVLIDQEYENIEKAINPDQNNDISKELKYHLYDFLKKCSSKFKETNFSNR